MKWKNFLFGLLTAVAGGAIALFTYTEFIEKPVSVSGKDSSSYDISDARAFLTSYQQQPGQIDFTFAAEQTVHAVVHVRTKSVVGQAENPIMEFFYGDRYSNRPREVAGFGSGVIISADGYIITNNHVIDEAEEIEVKLNDNRILKAELVGRDPATDLALLKVKADKLSFLKYGDSDNLKVGEWVLAVGNPFNLTSTVTAGIVSAKGRSLGILEGGGGGDYTLESFIQTDAALNMGNSGGALVDTKGNLVGITSAIYSPSGAYSGNSFAIPVAIVKKVITDIIEFGEVQRAIIGVNITDITEEDAQKFNLPELKGVKIVRVIENGAAAESNLRLDDIITKVNNVPVNSVSELQEQVGRYRPGDKVGVTYQRDGKQMTSQLTLRNVDGNTGVVAPGTSAGVVFGARLEGLSQNERRMYKIEGGVKIADLGEGRFRDIGLKRGTIITGVNGKKVNSADELRQATSGGTSLKTIDGFQADGTYFSYKFGN